jgi:hypothetical protein
LIFVLNAHHLVSLAGLLFVIGSPIEVTGSREVFKLIRAASLCHGRTQSFGSLGTPKTTPRKANKKRTAAGQRKWSHKIHYVAFAGQANSAIVFLMVASVYMFALLGLHTLS